MKIRTIPISKLVLDDHNANAGTKRGRALLEQSLKKYGAGRSVLIDKNNRVIAGNKTVEQARANGMKSIQVIETDGSSLVAVQRGDLDLKKHRAAKELAIADNRVSELDLEWNPEVLAGMDVDLSVFWNEGEMRKVLGDFAPPLPEAPEPKLDKAAELQRKWGTRSGQLWEIGRHRLMCGDSTDEKAVETLLAAHTPALCVTDPPYGVDYDPHWRDEIVGDFGQRAARGDGVANDGIADWSASWSLFEGPVAYIWHAGRHASAVQESLEKSGFVIRCQIIWGKQHFAISRGDYHWKHEPCWYAVRKGQTAKFVGDRTQTTLWEINSLNPGGRQEERVAHGTQKPLECMARPIRNHEGDVYDPFCGSGTTMCAAQLLDRICYAMEIEPKYVADALERLADMGLEPKLVKS